MAQQVVVVTAPDTHMGAGRTLLAVTSPTPLANGDNSAPVPTLGFDEAACLITGTFGAAGSVSIEGSFDNVNFFALPGVAAITAAGLTSVTALSSRFIRAHVTAGDGTTALIASILLRTKSR